MEPEQIPADLLETLQGARELVVLTGAGISAESGIPTFRQAQTGLWARYDPTELATRAAFERDPALVWNWYRWRRQLVQQAEPNAGHKALAQLARLVPQLTLVTQNVDGLHGRAGSPEVVELHGNIHRVKCLEEESLVSEWDDGEEGPPRCAECGAWLRPDVVWFGEQLPTAALEGALAAARTCDLLLCIGTSSLVQPAASLPYLALGKGAGVVEINPAATPLSGDATWVLQGPSGEVLPALLQAAWPD